MNIHCSVYNVTSSLVSYNGKRFICAMKKFSDQTDGGDVLLTWTETERQHVIVNSGLVTL